MRRVTRVDFPGESGLGEFRQGADFWDFPVGAARGRLAFADRNLPARLARDAALGIASHGGAKRARAPPRPKDVGAMDAARGKPAAAYRRGDRLGIFTVFDVDASELRLGIDDRHLDVRVSVLKVSGERRRATSFRPWSACTIASVGFKCCRSAASIPSSCAR